MSTTELRQRLIDKIQRTENKTLLQEADRLFGLETEDMEIYQPDVNHVTAIHEAKEQIEVLEDVKEAVEEMKLIKAGKLKARSAEDLLHEL